MESGSQYGHCFKLVDLSCQKGGWKERLSATCQRLPKNYFSKRFETSIETKNCEYFKISHYKCDSLGLNDNWFLRYFYALPEMLKQFTVQFPDSWFSGVAIIMGIIFFILTALIILFAVKLENREMRIMRQYLEAIAELNEHNQE